MTAGLAQVEHTRTMTILVAEDQAAPERALRINLRVRQYDVVAARSGREALALAASQPPDAVILDLGLPDIDGIADATAQSSGPAETLRLTPTEWAILDQLVQRPGQLVGSAQLLSAVWGPGACRQTNYLRFHMAHLRRKLEDDPARPRHLLTEPGLGYRYQP
jgi:two-component system, OmpR family, KDP operon response regulator KdpE